MASAPAGLSTGTSAPGTLYIFLHGLYVISETGLLINPGQELEVVLPSVPGHVYRAGTWLAEGDIDISIAPRGLRLHGVTQGGTSFSAARAFGIYLPRTTLTYSGRAATLILPQPRAILSLLHVVDGDYVAHLKRGTQTFKDIAEIQVLVYDYADENEVFLDGHNWEPGPIGRAISLHIISTSLEPETQEHDLATEAALSVVLNDYPGLQFKNDPRPLVPPWIDPDHPDYGLNQSGLQPYDSDRNYFIDANRNYAFAKAELEHPTLRFARMKRLARLFQGKQTIESLWTDPEPIGDRIANCGSVVTP